MGPSITHHHQIIALDQINQCRASIDPALMHCQIIHPNPSHQLKSIINRRPRHPAP